MYIHICIHAYNLRHLRLSHIILGQILGMGLKYRVLGPAASLFEEAHADRALQLEESRDMRAFCEVCLGFPKARVS